MTTADAPIQTSDVQQPSGNHRAFLHKLERDQRARRANIHRHHMNWFIFDFSWETADEEALAQDLARSEQLYQEELRHADEA